MTLFFAPWVWGAIEIKIAHKQVFKQTQECRPTLLKTLFFSCQFPRYRDYRDIEICPATESGYLTKFIFKRSVFCHRF